MELSFKAKIRIVYFFIFIFAVVIATRLFFIQIIKGDYYDNLASKQYNSSFSENFNRGSVYFMEKNGNRISAAVVKNGYQAEINTKFLENPE